MIACEFCSNNVPATADLTWGLYEGPDGRPRTEPYNHAVLCMQCFGTVGSAIEKITPLGTGLMHFTVKDVIQPP